MNRLLAAFLLAFPGLLGAATTTTPEALRGASNAAFSSLADFHAGLPAKSLVHVTGNVNLNGSGNVPRGAMQTWVQLSGYANVADVSGRVSSGSTWFNANVSCTINGGWVNCNDYPTWWVDFYRDGKLVGRGTVHGNISTQAYAPNGFFTVNAYTYLTGDVTVPE